MKTNYKLFSFGLIALAINSASAQCPTPTLVTATPSVICAGSTTSINATALGASINWFTVPVGGIAIGSSASAANFAVSPTITTTYYAESFASASVTYTFTNASATGSVGPTAPQITAAYLSTNLNGSVTVVGGIQQFTIPATGNYSIEARGAQGGGSAGGKGASIKGTFSLTAGQVLKILVGQQGLTTTPATSGGGGAFVAIGTTPLIVAGGGGSSTLLSSTCDGTTTANGQVAYGGWPVVGLQSYLPGTAGNGGDGSGGGGGGGGGGGFLSNGTISDPAYGFGFLNGGSGGTGLVGGGFGGGGGARDNGGSYWGGGAGGGYSGGAGACGTPGNPERAGGGGSFNSGTSQINTAGVNLGNGSVIITYLGGVGCTSVSRTSVTVTVNAKPTVSVTSGAICTGGSYTLSPSGASTYTYSGGSAVVSPTANTSYSITGTSSVGCVSSNTAVATVTVNALPTVTANSGTICSGSSFTITGSGASTYSYSSGSVVSPTATATYTVSGTSTLGCVGSAVSSVTVNPSPLVSATSSSSLICVGQSAILTASTSATTYTWNTGATTATISVSPTVTSTYTVSSVGTNGCVGNGNVTVNVSACTGINEAVANSISVYPNPTSGLVNVILTSELSKNSTIEVYDAIGKLVVKQVLTSEANAVNISNLTNGIYTFKVLNNSNVIKIGKIVKQ
jgi:hypothetical protein